MKIRESIEEWFYIITIASILFGGIAWLTNIDNKATAASEDLKDLKANIEQNRKQFEEIRTRLTHIEDAVKN
jgi:hypothetical protein